MRGSMESDEGNHVVVNNQYPIFEGVDGKNVLRPSTVNLIAPAPIAGMEIIAPMAHNLLDNRGPFTPSSSPTISFSPSINAKKSDDWYPFGIHPANIIFVVVIVFIVLMHVWIRKYRHKFHPASPSDDLTTTTTPEVFSIHDEQADFTIALQNAIPVEEINAVEGIPFEHALNDEIFDAPTVETLVRDEPRRTNQRFPSLAVLQLIESNNDNANRPGHVEKSNFDSENKFLLSRIGVATKRRSFDQDQNTDIVDTKPDQDIVNGLIFEFGDNSRTGKVVEYIPSFKGDNQVCYFEIDIQDNSVVDKLISTENWIDVRDGERMTHFSFSRAFNGSEHLCLKRCMFESVTLFLSDERHYSFGDVNPCKQVKFQIIEIPPTREAIRNIFDTSDVGYPILSSDIGYRLKNKSAYKGYKSLLHKIIQEASCNSRPWVFVDRRCKRSWNDVVRYIKICRSHVDGVTKLHEEIRSREGWYNWTPLDIAKDTKAPKEVINALMDVY